MLSLCCIPSFCQKHFCHNIPRRFPLARPRVDKSPAIHLDDRWHSPPCRACAAFLHSVRSTFATTLPVLFERRLKTFVFAGRWENRASQSPTRRFPLARPRVDKSPAIHLADRCHSLPRRACTAFLHSVRSTFATTFPVLFERRLRTFVCAGRWENRASQSPKRRFPLARPGIEKAPPSIWMIGAFRSSGRARTYNPSVNSRMLCH